MVCVSSKNKLQRVQERKVRAEKLKAFGGRSAGAKARRNVLPGALKMVNTNLAWGEIFASHQKAKSQDVLLS